MYCGLDFGTSNSTLGIIKDNKPFMVPLENSEPQIRSAIFMNDYEKRIVFGIRAINEYIYHEEGRLLMSIKSVLGSSIMEDKTRIFNKMKPFTEILGYFLAHIKQTGEDYCNSELNSVVLGRPVHFNDKDEEKDKRAENTLRSIAKDQGFKNIEFQYEPIAAAKTYAHTNPDGHLAVIVDIGGGTSDFTILRIGNESEGTHDDIIATAGVHIGGTDLDQLIALKKVMPILGMGSDMLSISGKHITLPSSTYHDLSTWHRIEQLYSSRSMRAIAHKYASALEKDKINRLMSVLKNREGHRLLEHCERSKINLSDMAESSIDMGFIEKHLEEPLTRNELNQIIDSKIESILNTLSDMNKAAAINPNNVDVVFFTGGTSRVVHLQECILTMYQNAKTVKGDVFGSVGIGLALEANEIFGE